MPDRTRILIVENDPAAVSYLSFVLADSNVQIVDSCEQALYAALELCPDILIVDDHLGEKTARLCIAAREQLALAHTRIIVLTARGGVPFGPQAYAAPYANVVLQRPFSRADLLAAVGVGVAV